MTDSNVTDGHFALATALDAAFPGLPPNVILLEDGDRVLLEDGSAVRQEH